VDWDKNPLLKEEREAKVARSTLHSSYDWAVAHGVSILSWRGQVIGSAFSDGRYRLQWSDKVHQGQAGSQAQAIRFMDRWIRARDMDAPFVDAKSKRSLVVPLGDFLRDYENGKT